MVKLFSDGLIGTFRSDPLVVIDLGARGEVDADLLELAPAVTMVGFEPDKGEAERLAGQSAGPWNARRILPYAIGGKTGPAVLHVPKEPEGASLLPHNAALIEEFGHEGLHRTLQQMPIDAMTLDDAAAEAGVASVDYLKIDIEGAELEVLASSPRLAPTAKVMKIECAFIEQRIGQPLASDVISHLSCMQFELIEMRAMQHWRRRPLPAHPYSVPFAMPYSRGRLAQADLLFAKRHAPGADGRNVAASMLILAALGHIDLAVTQLRRCVKAKAWWQERGIDIESELRAVSRAMGRRELARALRDQARHLVPLLKSRLGRLAFNKPICDY